MVDTICPVCGGVNPSSNLFCGYCGNPLGTQKPSPEPNTATESNNFVGTTNQAKTPCPVCGSLVRRVPVFDDVLCLVLLCIGIVPAICYALLTSGKYRCPTCGNTVNRN